MARKVAAKKASKAKSSRKTSKRTSSLNLDKKIEEKAYHLFEQRGYSHGDDWSDWFEAERLVKSRRKK